MVLGEEDEGAWNMCGSVIEVAVTATTMANRKKDELFVVDVVVWWQRIQKNVGSNGVETPTTFIH